MYLFSWHIPSLEVMYCSMKSLTEQMRKNEHRTKAAVGVEMQKA